jgi:hypothetical protein
MCIQRARFAARIVLTWRTTDSGRRWMASTELSSRLQFRAQHRSSRSTGTVAVELFTRIALPAAWGLRGVDCRVTGTGMLSAEVVHEVAFVAPSSNRSFSRVTSHLRMLGFIRSVALATCLAAPISSGLAQGVPVTRTEVDVFAPREGGIRWEGFTVLPSVVTGAVYDSNIFERHRNVVDDFVLYAQPMVTLVSNRRDASAIIEFGATHQQYTRSHDDTFTDLFSRFGARRALNRDFEFEVFGSYEWLHEKRQFTNKDLPDNLAGPAPHAVVTGGMTLVHHVNALVNRVTLRYVSDDYENVPSTAGERLNLRYKDNEKVVAEHEVQYDVTSRLRLFAIAGVEATDYGPQKGTDPPRDNTKTFGTLGTLFWVTPLINAKLTAAFDQQDFDSPLVHSKPGRFYTAQLTWLPRPQLSLFIRAARIFSDVNFTTDVSSSKGYAAAFGVDYLVNSRLRWISQAGFTHADEISLRSLSRTEDEVFVATSLGYTINRFWTLSLGYQRIARDSTSDEDTYKRDVVQALLISKF